MFKLMSLMAFYKFKLFNLRILMFILSHPGMRKTKKYTCIDSNIASGRHHAIQCDVCGQWHLLHIM